MIQESRNGRLKHEKKVFESMAVRSHSNSEVLASSNRREGCRGVTKDLSLIPARPCPYQDDACFGLWPPDNVSPLLDSVKCSDGEPTHAELN